MTTFPFDHLPVHGAEAPKLSALRDAGRASFTAMGGLPGARVEDFKYTPLAKLGEFRPREPHAVDRIPASVPEFQAVRLVLVNGRLDAGLSDLDALPKGVSVMAMADAVKDGAVLAMLGSTLPDQGLPMAGLNAARFKDGVAITIAAGAALELPLHLISITGAGAGIDPRHLVSWARPWFRSGIGCRACRSCGKFRKAPTGPSPFPVLRRPSLRKAIWTRPAPCSPWPVKWPRR